MLCKNSAKRSVKFQKDVTTYEIKYDISDICLMEIKVFLFINLLFSNLI